MGYKHSEKINRLFRKTENKPSYDILYDIAIKFPTLSMNWLITGEGNMLQKLPKNMPISTSSSLLPSPTNEDNNKDYIPLYDIIATAGSNIRFWESEENILDLIP